jgi:hypothetical protein
MSFELERHRKIIGEKSLLIIELETKNKATSESFQRERENWKKITTDKENAISNLQQNISEMQESLNNEKKKWISYETNKKDLMAELGAEMERAAIALEEERNLRKETERLNERISIAHKESVEKQQKAERERENYLTSVKSFEQERKQALDTLSIERDSWNKERTALQDKIDSKHRELINALKGASEQAEIEGNYVSKYKSSITQQKEEIEKLKVFDFIYNIVKMLNNLQGVT